MSTTLKGPIIIRVDFNVPVKNNVIQDPTRILSAKQTIEYFSDYRIILTSHFKDPTPNDIASDKYSFAPILGDIKKYLDRDVVLLDLFDENLSAKIEAAPRRALILLENSRFWPGEKTCSDELSQRIASLGCVFVNEAFSCSHRAHASVYGVAKHLPAYPGFHFMAEVNALSRVLKDPHGLDLAIVGGAKVSTKLPILENLLPKVKQMMIGGAMAHTFLVALGMPVGRSLFEPAYVDKARELMNTYANKILLPSDLVIAKDLSAPSEIVNVGSIMSTQNAKLAGETTAPNAGEYIPDDCAAYDIGPNTVRAWEPIIKECRTIIWNGTLGVAEQPPFDEGTQAVAQCICRADAFSVAGGGDTLAALTQLGATDYFSHVCTGGGAFLEWLSAEKLVVDETFVGVDLREYKS
ncbi:MAG: phosphoglycerate kinase [Holosporales bacterium]|jgi:phosphoglycerate kinase|nr:phosphoglycerate kinase [Holosporales bacterium]